MASVGLLQIARDVRLMILENLPDQRSRRNVSLTCKLLHFEVQEYLWKDVELCSEAGAKAYFDAVGQKPHRLDMVHHYGIHFDFSRNCTSAFQLIALLRNLKSMNVEMPQGNINALTLMDNNTLMDADAAYLRVEIMNDLFNLAGFWLLRNVAAPNFTFLKHLKVDMGFIDGTLDLFNFNDLYALFFNHGLSSFSIANLDFSEPHMIFVLPHGTSLQSLELKHCYISFIALMELLHVPAALRELRLTQTRCISDGWEQRSYGDPGNGSISSTPIYGVGRWCDAITAILLSGQAEGMEHLELTSYDKDTPEPGMEMPIHLFGFPALRSLQVDTEATVFCDTSAKFSITNHLVETGGGGVLEQSTMLFDRS